MAPPPSALRGTSDAVTETTDQTEEARRRGQETPAPSRIFQTPTYDQPAASGAADSGFDSLNRSHKKPKLLPGQPGGKPAGPGSPMPLQPTSAAASGATATDRAAAIGDRQQAADAACHGRHHRRPAAAPASQSR